MPFLTIGIEHRTAPLSIRERVAFTAEAVERVSQELLSSPSISEAAILSTCNRTELYLFAEDPVGAGDVAVICLIGRDDSLRPYVQRWEELEAAEHLFRVASGLESQLPGESQILSQVRETLETGQRLGTIRTNLHSLFRSAISCARQARAGTALGRVHLSIGAEAVHAASEALGGLRTCSALLVGGGEVVRLAAQALQAERVKGLYIANRTASVAEELARQYGGRPAPFADVSHLLPHVDMVICATSAQHYILTPDDLPLLAMERRKRPLLIFDLAIPRDVDPMVASIPGVDLRDLEDLLPSGVESEWEEDIRAMEAVIAAEIQEFMAWYLTRRVVPVIASLRSHVEAVAQQELKRVRPQLANLTDREHAAVESLTQRLIDKMFHHLVVRLRLAAQTDAQLVDAAEFFFLHGEGGLFPHAAQSNETPSELKT